MKIFRSLIAFVIPLLWLFYSCAALAANPNILLGDDRIMHPQYLRLLKGKRVALIANFASRNSEGQPIIETFFHSPKINLVAIFTPEHGLRVKKDKKVHSEYDHLLKVPIYSLYGASKKPTAEQLKNVDVLVFDLQSVGMRYYTYASTMAIMMQAAKKYNKPIIILDRVNPLGGKVVAGPISSKDMLGYFTSYFPVPMRYGLTMGELARYYNRYFHINAKLTVVPLLHWQRRFLFNQTDLQWVAPSPALPTFQQAFLYGIFGPMESLSLAVGRGITNEHAFHYFGAPWMTVKQSQELVRRLKALHLPGLKFSTVTWTPTRREFLGEPSHGFKVRVTDYHKVKAYKSLLSVLQVMHYMFGDKLKLEKTRCMIGQGWVLKSIDQHKSIKSILKKTKRDNQAFMQKRKTILLYR